MADHAMKGVWLLLRQNYEKGPTTYRGRDGGGGGLRWEVCM